MLEERLKSTKEGQLLCENGQSWIISGGDVQDSRTMRREKMELGGGLKWWKGVQRHSKCAEIRA